MVPRVWRFPLIYLITRTQRLASRQVELTVCVGPSGGAVGRGPVRREFDRERKPLLQPAERKRAADSQRDKPAEAVHKPAERPLKAHTARTNCNTISERRSRIEY